ncbi:PWWP domain-containing protein 2A [Fasciola gigantica]|uniref:PWWP domain-containing protein 2A n=1 Tax=Fasciola gigantica TaxID=46835 RepID=A0A504YUG3_FASGI|nr:PWWP domain-containing protein 2A [Fasciola gigantica]
MATSPSAGGVQWRKGEFVSVEVVESSADLMSVKFMANGKLYRGILLQEEPSHYGVNPERIRGAPFWPPLNSAGISLKTIPCSTERYSYKFEGQPSALTVFQPEVIKRSNRNQPAPQLSRILRPRRFVCRKCKKAYHVEEENGIEMSSTALSLQIERSSQDGVTASSDNEATQVPSPNSAISKVLRGSRSKWALADDNSQMQSIRRVAPSIIPKLNDDYGLSGRESEADSNSDEAVVVRQKKMGSVERTSTHDEPSVPAMKSTIPTKRKAESVSKTSRSKKIRKATLYQPSLSDITSTVKACDSIERTATDAADEDVSLTLVSDSVTADLKPQLPAQCTENSLAVHKPDNAIVRKNRIKAQYVSVATPFRFPPSRSSKPNLFVNNPFGTGIKEKSTTPKRARNTESSPKKSKSDTGVGSPITSRKTDMSSLCDPCGSKKTESSLVRSRTRGRSTQSMQSSTTVNPTSPKGSTGSSSSLPPSSSEHNTASVGDVVYGLCSTESITLTVKYDANVDTAFSTNPCLQSKTNPPNALLLQASSHTSTQSSESVDGGNCRSRSMDYEKPKNRWIREARARRSQEERAPGLTVTNPSITTASLPSSSSSDVAISSSNGLSSPTLSRLRMRSGDVGLGSLSPSANVSPKASSVTKKRNSAALGSNEDGSNMLSDEVTAKPLAAPTTCSPRGAPGNSEASSVSLPVLKIKINRQRQPSCSSSNNAQYEVVELQVHDLEQTAVCKSHSQDLVGTTSSAAADMDTDKTESKPAAFYNGSPATGDASPTLSANSLHKDICSTKAPGLGRLVKRCKLPDGVVFRVGDLVWSKLSGWPYWPAQITSIHQSVVDEQEINPDVIQQPDTKSIVYTACLHWFAWHQVSYMTCDKLYHFMQHYRRFDNKRKRGVFRQAVNEACQAADEKRNEISSSSDADSGLENENVDIHSHNITWGLHVSPRSLELSSGPVKLGQELTTVALATSSTTDNLPQKEASPPSEVTTTTTVADVSQLVGSSIPVYSSQAKQHQSSGPVRRGTSRGRVRGIRGRRRGQSVSSGLGQTSFRNPPSFLSPFQNDTKTPYDQFDEMDAVQAPVPFRRKNTLSTRGRGTFSKTGVVADPVLEDSTNKDNPLQTVSAPPASTGSLKIKLSTAHLRLPVGKKRRSAKPKVSRRRTKSIPEVGNAVASMESSALSAQSASSVVSSNSDQAGPNPNQLPTTILPNYEEPSQAILSQFPHVFPDLRPGTLSDAVEIPTFSEDESEEENTGRLIIDPEVVAAVNVSNTLPTVVHQTSVSCGRSEDAMLEEALYSGSCFHSLPEPTTAARTNLDPLFAHAIPNLMDPDRCRPPETVFGFKPSHCSSGPASINSAPLYHHTNFAARSTSETTASSMLPFSCSASNDLPCLPRSHTLDLFDPTSNSRASYFRPSSHMGAAPVTTPNAVPYVTSNFPTR